MLLSVKAQKRDLLPDSISMCWGDSTFIEIKENLENNSFITWTTPQGIITNAKRLTVQKAGKYYVKVNSAFSGKIYTDSCVVRIAYKLKPMMRDTSICKGRTIVLDAKHAGYRYHWNTGETTQKIQIESAGRYWVKIKNGNCTSVDTVIVKQLPGVVVSVPSELLFCAHDEPKLITAKAGSGTRYYWSTGATTPTVQVNKEGVYWLRSESPMCGKQTDSIHVKIKMCECEMIIPASFSPNEDNRNDYFYPISSCFYSYFFITISDRWGNVVYTSTNINGKWDGRFKGNLCPEDIYVYHIETTERGGEKKQVRNGKISLFR